MPKYNLPVLNEKVKRSGFISISQAAKILQVNPDTLRNWEKQGKIAVSRTSGGARRYNLAELNLLKKEIQPRISKSSAMLSISKASSMLSISKDTLRNWEKKGLVQTLRTKGGARRFSKSEIKRLQQELGFEAKPIHLKPVSLVEVESKKTPGINWFKVASSTGFFLFLTGALIVGYSYINSSINSSIESTNLRSEAVLGEKTEAFRSEIVEIVKVLEDLQVSVNSIQTKDEPEYLYLPAIVAKFPEEFDSDILPSSSSLSIGSSEKFFNQGYIKEISTQNIATDNFEISGISFLSGSEVPENSIGESGDYYLRKKDSSAGLYLKIGSSWSSFNLPGMQKVYEEGNNISTLDGRDIKITLTDTPLDPNFQITIAGDNFFSINDDGTFSDSTPFTVSSMGKVGIGTTTPIAKLHLIDESSSPDSDILRLDSQVLGVNNTVFRVDIEGDTFLDGSITAGSVFISSGNADIAEEYISSDNAEPGDLVVIDDGIRIRKSNIPYQSELIGIVSTVPGFTLSLKEEENLKKLPIALVGRVPVKVNMENGAIEKGDYLTSSSTPGVAMKATKPGQVIGKALESFNGSFCHPELVSGSQIGPESSSGRQFCFNKIIAFVNITFADPTQALANLILDEEGNLVIPKIKTDSLEIGTISNPSNSSNPFDPSPIEVASKLKVIDEAIVELGTKNLELGNKIKELEASAAAIAQNLIPSSTGPDLFELELTPPEELLATASAKTIDLEISEALSTLDLTVSGVMKSLGNTFLGNTTIAGDLVIDGTTSISQNSLNSLTTLYLQNSPLAEYVDLFNGLVTIDKNGNIIAQSIVVAEFKVFADKITGSGIIKKGTKSTLIENPIIRKNSRVLVTPTSETDLVLAVIEKSDNKSFKVSAPKEVTGDIVFDWWMISEE